MGVRVLPEHLHRALGGGEPEHGIGRRGVARAIVADEAVDAAGRDVEIEPVQDLGLAEFLLEAADRNDGIGHFLSPLSSASRVRPRASIWVRMRGHSSLRKVSRSWAR